MDNEVFRTLWDQDGLMSHIISYVAPKDVSAAFHQASGLVQAKPRLLSIFLQHLRSLPLTASYWYEDLDERPILWAKHHQLKIGRLEADVSVVHIRGFIGCMTGMDLSELKHLTINLMKGNLDFNPRDVASVYQILNQPSLVELEMHDTSNTDHYLRLLGIQGLKKVTLGLRGDNQARSHYVQEVLVAMASSPSIEHFKAKDWIVWDGVEIASPTLKSLDVGDCFMPIGRVLCPSLKKFICSDWSILGDTRVAALVADAEEEVLDSDAPPGATFTSKKVLSALQANDPDNFQVGEDCQLVAYGFRASAGRV